MKSKICSKCRIEKPLNEFHKNSYEKDGYHHRCKKCRKEYCPPYTKRGKQYNESYKKRNYYRFWARSTLSNHRRSGYITNITLDELEKMARQIKKCPICEIPLLWEAGHYGKGNNPSLDRTNNGKILDKNNIQIICRKCNTIKQDKTMKEFIDYCEMVYKKFGGGI